MSATHRLDWVVGALVAAVLLVVAVTATSLVRMGSRELAVAVGLVGLAVLLAIGVGGWLARDAAAQVPPQSPASMPARPAPVEPPRAARSAFKVREARPGEIPAPYLEAVMKGAQATRAAQKARAAETDEARH